LATGQRGNDVVVGLTKRAQQRGVPAVAEADPNQLAVIADSIRQEDEVFILADQQCAVAGGTCQTSASCESSMPMSATCTH
jgi:hypothetical protein